MKSKEEILGQSFYPHECGGMIDCVTKLDALKAMEEYAQQFASQPPAQGEGAEEVLARHIPNYRNDPKEWGAVWPVVLSIDMSDNFTQKIIAAMHEYRNLPPSGNLWEEVDAVKEPPGEDGEYFILVKNQVCREFNTVAFMEDKVWRIPSNYTVISYLRPVTGQRYSEEDGETIANWLMVNTSLNVEKIVDLKQFIQSLHLKSR